MQNITPSMKELFDLTGQTALVTGSSRGLGLEIACGLGECGAKVAVVARREQWLQAAVDTMRSQGIDCRPYRADIGQSQEAISLVDQVKADWGRIDILVNNAGIAWGEPALEVALERVQQVLDVNVLGAFQLTQLVGRVMVDQGGGSIVNIASVAGTLGMPPEIMDTVGYAASKGAIIALTRDLAVKWARYGIRVNAIAPGFFPTRLSQNVLSTAAELIVQRVPLGRLGQPGEIKACCVFLASRAAGYITGQVLHVDGGATATF